VPETWQRLGEANIYTAILVAATVEGLGLPVPAELLYVVAGVLVHQGKATLAFVILAGVAGNVLGSLMGYTLAYLGGAPLLRRLVGILRIKPVALRRMEQFFHRYGALTVFFSRFIGLIRAATIYSAGLARMNPWTFAGYLLASALVWNGVWAAIAVALGGRLPHLWEESMSYVAAVVVLAVALGAAIMVRRQQAGRE